jgi:hypothetical protein
VSAEAEVRVSACIDCATPIIGERLRCPACHDRHASAIAAAPLDVVDEGALTTPRPRHARDADDRLIAWFVVVATIVGLMIAILLMLKECS